MSKVRLFSHRSSATATATSESNNEKIGQSSGSNSNETEGGQTRVNAGGSLYGARYRYDLYSKMIDFLDSALHKEMDIEIQL
jgi:hypothetical protein